LPKFTENEIKKNIANGSISAISLDTVAFDTYDCNLGYVTLARLDQFKRGGIKLLLSEIVVKEVTAHIARQAAETQRVLKSSLKRHKRRWDLGIDLEKFDADLQLNVDFCEAAKEQVEEYLEVVGAEVISAASKSDLAVEVLRRYFEVIAPFEAREGKKHEFPDAFALLSLEQEAVERKTLLLCVSADKGWAKFAERSDHIVVVPKLDITLSWFNDPGRIIAKRAVALWKAKTALDIDSEVNSAFEYYLDGLWFEIEGDAPLDYEAEPLSAVLQYLDLDAIEAPVVIAEDDDQVTFSTTAIAKVGFEAEFNFYVHDSIDGDNVGLGSQSLYLEKELPFEITISVSREINEGQPEVLEASVRSHRIVVNFGHVEPFPNEESTHEKY
jgi:hypothetical protein